jgi:prolyl 4-hydroxylase
MPLVSKWSGGFELEPTDFYGMRIYRRGAVLYSHVDREQTHVLSFVLNVAQSELEAPWALEVGCAEDLDGGERAVVLNPGEVRSTLNVGQQSRVDTLRTFALFITD